MKPLMFDWKDTARIGRDELKQYEEQLKPEVMRIREARAHAYDTDYASINAPFDQAMLAQVLGLVAEKRELVPTMLIVIGIGGSSLGMRAVHEAVNGLYYNEQQPDIKCYVVETVDSDCVWDVLLLAEQVLEQQGRVLVNVISKSGTTLETIANAQLFIQLLKNYCGEQWRQYLVITTDQDSKLWRLAQQEHISCLPIPALIGGRYSVFSSAGLFPLAMLNVDIRGLCAGAQALVQACCDERIEHNPAALSAALLAHHYFNGKTIHDTFLFATSLEGLGKWYRQLMGESIGKEFDRDGGRVRIGITPTVSIGSTDLHSVGQLYLGGPRDKFTTFVTVAQNELNCIVPRDPLFENLVANIQDKPLSLLMDAIIHGTQKAYRAQELPFMTCTLADTSPASMGQFLQSKMMEIMYLGFLLEVNPFDQPQVEYYKQETRKILAHE